MDTDGIKEPMPAGLVGKRVSFQVRCSQDESTYPCVVDFTAKGGAYYYTPKGGSRIDGQYTLRRVEEMGGERVLLHLDFRDDGQGEDVLSGQEVISLEVGDGEGVKGEGVWWTTDGRYSGVEWVQP